MEEDAKMCCCSLNSAFICSLWSKESGTLLKWALKSAPYPHGTHLKQGVSAAEGGRNRSSVNLCNSSSAAAPSGRNWDTSWERRSQSPRSDLWGSQFFREGFLVECSTCTRWIFAHVFNGENIREFPQNFNQLIPFC